MISSTSPSKIKSVTALININSGSVPETAAQELTDALADMSISCVIHNVEFDDPHHEGALADAHHSDAIIVWGGDGTAGSILTRAALLEKPVLVLPGGTMNLVHQRVRGYDRDWRKMLQLLLVGVPTSLTAGCANDAMFFVAAMMGKLTKLAEPRESLRDGAVLEAAATLLRSDALDLQQRIRVRDLGPGRETIAEDATAVAVFVDQTPDQPFEIGAISPSNLLDLTQISINAALQGWRDAEGMQTGRTSEILIESIDGSMFELQLDGEAMPSATSVRITRAAKSPLVFMEPENMAPLMKHSGHSISAQSEGQTQSM